MTDVRITNKIPNNAVGVSYNKKNDILNVQLLDNDKQVLLTQPIRINADSLVTDVKFNKSLNTITVYFSDNPELTISLTRHLSLTNGDLEVIRGTDCVLQQIDVGLHLLKGDWVLDSTAGVDYFGGLRAYPEILNADIKKAINTVENVDTVLKYSFVEDINQEYKVRGTVKVGNSEIPINSLVRPVGK